MALNPTVNQQVGGGEAAPSVGTDGLDVFAEAWAEENGEETPINSEAPVEEEETTADPQEDPEESDVEEAEQEPDDQPQTHEVTVDGDKLQVSLDELKRGYQRLSSFTRGKQEIARDREAVQARAAVVEQAEAHLLNLLERYDAPEQAPNWVELQRQDPLGFQERQATYMQRQAEAQAAQAERQKLQEQRQQREQAAYQEHLQRERQALLAKMPEVKGDGDKAKKILSEALVAVRETYGFTPAENDAITEHRSILALIDAHKWRQLQKAKPSTSKQVTAAPRSVRPGQPANVSQNLANRMSAVTQNLVKTGSKDAFADLWELSERGQRASR